MILKDAGGEGVAVKDVDGARVGGEGLLESLDELPEDWLGEGVVEIDKTRSSVEFKSERVLAKNASGRG